MHVLCALLRAAALYVRFVPHRIIQQHSTAQHCTLVALFRSVCTVEYPPLRRPSSTYASSTVTSFSSRLLCPCARSVLRVVRVPVPVHRRPQRHLTNVSSSARWRRVGVRLPPAGSAAGLRILKGGRHQQQLEHSYRQSVHSGPARSRAWQHPTEPNLSCCSFVMPQHPHVQHVQHFTLLHFRLFSSSVRLVLIAAPEATFAPHDSPIQLNLCCCSALLLLLLLHYSTHICPLTCLANSFDCWQSVLFVITSNSTVY